MSQVFNFILIVFTIYIFNVNQTSSLENSEENFKISKPLLDKINSHDEKIKAQPKYSITILMKNGVDQAYNSYTEALSEMKLQTNDSRSIRGSKITLLRDSLIKNMRKSQRKVWQLLDSESVKYQSFWVSNSITIRQAPIPLIRKLGKMSEIKLIRDMVKFPVQLPISTENDHSINDGNQEENPNPDKAQWGVKKIRAHLLWNKTRGEGIVVALIDSGVRLNHTILMKNFVGKYGWFQPRLMSPSPIDVQGHGSHVCGTMVGQEGYGVAPGSKWMACMGCTKSVCWEDDLLTCGQFVTCPTNPKNTTFDCSKAPHVVNNSWGTSKGGATYYADVVKAWTTAGIIPVFSAGNSGPRCKTVGSPADMEGVISVAATDFHDGIAFFSSHGPSLKGKPFKPEISAPGYNIMSANYKNDTGFVSMSGTSMASPHLTGGIALLLSARPEWIGNFEAVRNAIFNTAEQRGLHGLNRDCNGTKEDVFPNHAFGYGRLDVFAASKFEG